MLTALCAVAPLLLGGVPDWTVWFTAVPLGFLSLSQSFRSPQNLSTWLLVPAALTLYYAIQLIPIPISLLEVLSPQSALWAMDVGLTVAPLSLNPYETQLSMLVQFCFVTALFLGRLVSTSQVRYLVGWIAFSACSGQSNWLATFDFRLAIGDGLLSSSGRQLPPRVCHKLH